MSHVCECPDDVPACPKCGRVWDWYRLNAHGRRVYTSNIVKRRYENLFGNIKSAPFMKVEKP